MAVKWLVGVFLIIALVGFLMYYETNGTIVPSDIPFGQYLEETTKFADGSLITFLVPDQPESEKSKPPREKIVKDKATGKDVIVPVEVDAPTPVTNVSQHSKSNTQGVQVQGYIIITDSATGEPIKPYVYNVLVQIKCDDALNDVDGFSYCNTDGVFGRVQTADGGRDEDGLDKGGYFLYKWYPKNADSLAFYEIKVVVTSDVKNAFGLYDNYVKTYSIQVID